MKKLTIRLVTSLFCLALFQLSPSAFAQTKTTTEAEATTKNPAEPAPKTAEEPTKKSIAKKADANVERFKDWALGCDEISSGSKKQCYIYQTVINQENSRPILQVAVGYLPIRNADVQPAALFTLPLGVFLSQGVTISVDGAAPIRFPYEQCTSVGCSAILPLNNDLLAKLKKGNKADIVVDEGARLLVIELSLSGFTAGFKKVTATK